MMTLEERNALRARIIQRVGYDYTISETTAEEILAMVAPICVIRSVEFTGHRLAIEVMTRNEKTSRARIQLETELSHTYGNAPYQLSTEFTNYRLTFVCN